MKKFLFISLIATFIACTNQREPEYMSFSGVPMGISINDFCNQLIEKDSAWTIVDSLSFSETDTCFYTIMHYITHHRIKDLHYDDSILIMPQLTIRSTPKTKTVFLLEHEVLIAFDNKDDISLPDEYILVEGYYGAVYGCSMAYQEYPNCAPWTSRYRREDGIIMIKNEKTNKFEEGKETYDIIRNTYEAMWKWKYGEIMCSLGELSINTMYIDSKGYYIFDAEAQLYR